MMLRLMEVAKQIVQLNSQNGRLTAEGRMDRATFDTDGNLRDWDLAKLETLPETFGRLQIVGNLSLNKNKLNVLPETFRNIQVGGASGCVTIN